MKPKILLWGASGHARVVAEIVKLREEYELIGFLDDIADGAAPEEFCGVPLFHGREHLDRLFREGLRHAIIAFGHCAHRLKAADHLRARGFTLATAIHPAAIIARDVVIGEGTVIAAGAVINPAVRIGANVIINTSASVDHETIVADGAHICPGVHLAGQVSVGTAAWVGIGSTVVDRACIGDGALIGAGSVVIQNIPPNTLAYGVPARIKKRIDTWQQE